MKNQTFTVLEWHELEKLAKENFGIDYEYMAEEELNNDTSQSYDIEQTDIDEFLEDGKEEWLEFIAGKRAWRAHLLLTALVVLGELPMGNILVEISY